MYCKTISHDCESPTMNQKPKKNSVGIFCSFDRERGSACLTPLQHPQKT